MEKYPPPLDVISLYQSGENNNREKRRIEKRKEEER
jgi:hypothetical protein